MTEADVRNAGMSQETEDDFREMTYVQRVFLFVSIARNMYSFCNLEFKTWKQTDLLDKIEKFKRIVIVEDKFQNLRDRWKNLDKNQQNGKLNEHDVSDVRVACRERCISE